MRWLIPIFLLSIISFSCGSGKTDSTENLSSDTVAKSSKEEFMALYYLNDDKYAIDDPVINIEEWIDQKIEFISMYGDSNSLFQRKGGGPAGSEWNPSNDFLFLCKRKNKSEKVSQIMCTLNGSQPNIEFNIKDNKDDQTILYAIYPLHLWDSLLFNNSIKPIPDPELEIPPDIEVYYLKFIIQVSLTSGDTKSFSDYFLSSYGE